jgi:hypothetical protein
VCVSVSRIVDERTQLEMDIFIIYVYIISGEVGKKYLERCDLLHYHCSGFKFLTINGFIKEGGAVSEK